MIKKKPAPLGGAGRRRVRRLGCGAHGGLRKRCDFVRRMLLLGDLACENASPRVQGFARLATLTTLAALVALVPQIRFPEDSEFVHRDQFRLIIQHIAGADALQTLHCLVFGTHPDNHAPGALALGNNLVPILFLGLLPAIDRHTLSLFFNRYNYKPKNILSTEQKVCNLYFSYFDRKSFLNFSKLPPRIACLIFLTKLIMK
mgnify:CR=1 FL=1